MNPTEFWPMAFCICGAAQCIFLSVCFILHPGESRLQQQLLAFLLLLLGIRILKSVLYIFEGEEMLLLLMNLGFAAHIGAAAVLYLYFRTQYHGSEVKQLNNWLHLFPAIAIVFTSAWLTLDGFWYKGAYHCLLFGSLIYWFLSLIMFLKIRQKQDEDQSGNFSWLLSLIIGTGVFFFAYFSNYVLRILPYSTAPLIYSLAVFPLGFSAWRNFSSILHSKSPIPQKKYQNLSLSAKDLEQGKKSILSLMETEEVFLEPDFSLAQLVERTQIPSHILSHILNQYLQTNFTTLINRYRVEKACHLLCQTDKQHFTIAAIAFEVGFSSLSVFNYNFKKIKGTTPSAFRKRKVV